MHGKVLYDYDGVYGVSIYERVIVGVRLVTCCNNSVFIFVVLLVAFEKTWKHVTSYWILLYQD